LLVRFLHVPAERKAAEDRAVATFFGEAAATDGFVHPGSTTARISVETIEQLRMAAAGLSEASKQLAPAYVARFDATNAMHRAAAYAVRPSFLVPPLKVREESREERLRVRCANPACKKEEVKGEKAFHRCSRCLSAHYCGGACQKAHWKVHKAVCKKSAAELGGGTAQGKRASLIFPIDVTGVAHMPPAERERITEGGTKKPWLSNMDHTGRSGTKMWQPDGKMPRNVHGDAEVKSHAPPVPHPQQHPCDCARANAKCCTFPSRPFL